MVHDGRIWHDHRNGASWVEAAADEKKRVDPVRGAGDLLVEAIHLIGKDHRFEGVAELFEGLNTLDPDLVQRLLEACRSFKVRRVFLYLARESGHDWFSKLDETKVDCGKGKREVVKGGRLDSRYKITVPRKLEEPDV